MNTGENTNPDDSIIPIDPVAPEVKIKKYVIVEFVKRGPKTMKTIDIVPSSWIDYNEKTKKFCCPFPPSPYTELESMVRNRSPPDESWDIYNIRIKGQAKTYKSAMKKWELLKTGEYAFSTDADFDDAQIALELEKLFRSEKLKKSADELKRKYQNNLKDADTVESVNMPLDPDNDEQDCNLALSLSQLTLALNANTLSFPINCITEDGVLLFESQQQKCDNSTVSAKELKSSTSISQKEYQEIIKKLISLEVEIKEMSNLMRKMWNFMGAQFGNKGNLKTFFEKYDIEFPIKYISKLIELDKTIKENRKCRRDLVATIGIELDAHILSRSSANILKLIFNRELAIKFTASKKMGTKEVFRIKTPEICDCIVEILMSHHNVSKDQVLSALGTAFTNSKDWDGNRKRKLKEDQ